LLTNDETYFRTSDLINSRIVIGFDCGWEIHPTGFTIRSGPDSFPRYLAIIAKKEYDDDEEIPLTELKDEQYLCSPFRERAFPIISNDYFQEIEFIQTGTNSGENNIFCLSQIEIYGELKCN
jgi:hypothetical protein